MSRWVYLKILAFIGAMLVLSLVAAVFIHERVEHEPERGIASVRSPIFEDRGDVTAQEVFSKTGIRGAARARKVIFHPEVFPTGANLPEQLIAIEPFPGHAFVLRLQASSVLGQNEGILVGQIDGDEDSKVRFEVDGSKLKGEIDNAKRSIQILYAGDGYHFIVEKTAFDQR